MSKRKSNRSHSMSRSRVARVSSFIHNPNQRLRPRVSIPHSFGLSLTDISDNRRFHPHAKNRPLYDIHARRVIPRNIVRHGLYSHPRRGRSFPIFERLSVTRLLPRDAIVCVRRHQRREVLFASSHIGRGRGGGQRTPHFNENSQLVCKR